MAHGNAVDRRPVKAPPPHFNGWGHAVDRRPVKAPPPHFNGWGPAVKAPPLNFSGWGPAVKAPPSTLPVGRVLLPNSPPHRFFDRYPHWANPAHPVKAPPAGITQATGLLPEHQVLPGMHLQQEEAGENTEATSCRPAKARRLTGRFTTETNKQACKPCSICGCHCEAHMTSPHEWATEVRAPEDASMDTS